MELGIVWPPTWSELDRVGLNLIKLKFSPNSSQVFHRLATSVNSIQLSPSCFVIVMWLRGFSKKIEWFSCELARLGSTVWPPADASFDFVTWLELAWVGSTVWPGLKRKERDCVQSTVIWNKPTEANSKLFFRQCCALQIRVAIGPGQLPVVHGSHGRWKIRGNNSRNGAGAERVQKIRFCLQADGHDQRGVLQEPRWRTNGI